MTIEFIVAHAGNDSGESCTAVREALVQAFETEGLDNERTEIEQMIVPQYWRDEAETVDKDAGFIRRCVLGFSLEIPDHLGTNSDLIDEFVDGLRTEPLAAHVVRFEDPGLFELIKQWSEEIFILEMKIRRALTMIYLVAANSGDPYDLLREEVIRPQKNPKKGDMELAVENQFFHLLFNNYYALNERPKPKIEDVMRLINESADLSAIQNELERAPIQEQTDRDFIANLKEASRSVEDMRNCVAHYRRPPQRLINSYETAKITLSMFVDEFLERLRISQGE